MAEKNDLRFYSSTVLADVVRRFFMLTSAAIHAQTMMKPFKKQKI